MKRINFLQANMFEILKQEDALFVYIGQSGMSFATFYTDKLKDFFPVLKDIENPFQTHEGQIIQLTQNKALLLYESNYMNDNDLHEKINEIFNLACLYKFSKIYFTGVRDSKKLSNQKLTIEEYKEIDNQRIDFIVEAFKKLLSKEDNEIVESISLIAWSNTFINRHPKPIFLD